MKLKIKTLKTGCKQTFFFFSFNQNCWMLLKGTVNALSRDWRLGMTFPPKHIIILFFFSIFCFLLFLFYFPFFYFPCLFTSVFFFVYFKFNSLPQNQRKTMKSVSVTPPYSIYTTLLLHPPQRCAYVAVRMWVHC